MSHFGFIALLFLLILTKVCTKPVPTVQTTGPVPTVQTTEPVPTVQTTRPVPTVQTTGPVPTVQTTGPVPTVHTTGPVPTVQITGLVPMVQTTGPGTTVQTTGPVPTVQTTDPSQELKNPNSDENIYRSYSLSRGIQEGFSELAKWLLIALAIIVVGICLCLRYLRDFCDKHGDKIPLDKILNLYKKPQLEDN